MCNPVTTFNLTGIFYQLMRTSTISVVVVAMLVLAGCSGGPGTGDTGPSPDDFPTASAIDQSVFDRHAAVLANGSFTLTVERTQKQRRPSFVEGNFTYTNGTARYLVEPDASQYLAQVNDYFAGNVTYYSNGSTTYQMWRKDNELTVKQPPRFRIFNESSEGYLWRGWFNDDSEDRHELTAVNATYERRGVETFRDVSVMRYEATGVDALPDWAGKRNASSVFEAFSATLLIDSDGIIRQFRYEFVYADHRIKQRLSRTYTVTDVGDTDVRKPDWASNVTSGS